MGFYSILPYFVCMTGVFLLANTPILSWADLPPKNVPTRAYSLDGLRGILALGVFFHHAAIYHQYLQTGQWTIPPTRFYADLGQTGVAMFFFITGYLFWSQMLRVRGRPNFLKLYIGRVFRIVPLYLFLSAIVLFSVGFLTQWTAREPTIALIKHAARWLAGGVIMGGDVNGYANTGLISANVTWSLRYEWMFYASLLVSSFFCRIPLLGKMLPATGVLVFTSMLLVNPNNVPLAADLMFCVGMTCASAKTVSAFESLLKVPQWLRSTATVVSIALVLLFFDGVYAAIPVLLLGIAFALIVYESTVFGLLLTKPAKRLGDISYGIYLLQGPVYFVAFTPEPVRAFALKSAWGHWTVVALSAFGLLLLATLTHVAIERPGIKAGERVWAKVEASIENWRKKYWARKSRAES